MGGIPLWWNSKVTDFEVYAFAMHYYMPRYFIRVAFITGVLTDKTMVDKLIYIPNDNKQNYPFYKQQMWTLTVWNQPIINQKRPQSF